MGKFNFNYIIYLHFLKNLKHFYLYNFFLTSIHFIVYIYIYYIIVLCSYKDFNIKSFMKIGYLTSYQIFTW